MLALSLLVAGCSLVVSSLVALVVSSLVSGRVELGVEVEGRVAEWSRDAEEDSGARVRRCGPETPLAGRSASHTPLPEHQQFPPPLPR